MCQRRTSGGGSNVKNSHYIPYVSSASIISTIPSSASASGSGCCSAVVVARQRSVLPAPWNDLTMSISAGAPLIPAVAQVARAAQAARRLSTFGCFLSLLLVPPLQNGTDHIT